MEWYFAYKQELEDVFRQAEERTATFPAPFQHQGLDYLARFNPLREDSTRNYICYLLPFWLQEITGLAPEICRKLSLGNVFVMAHYLIQDDVMDTAADNRKTQLALSQLFYTECLSIYRDLFPASSPFWLHSRTYVDEWAVSVTSEGTEDYFQGKRLQVALKASPLKMAGTGALLLAGRADLIEVITNMTDTALLVLQMSDDWADWAEDWEENSYNCLLSHISAEQKTVYREGLSPEKIQEAIYVRGILASYAGIADQAVQQLESMEPSVPDLRMFARSIAEELGAAATEIESGRSHLRRGGLDFWLSKNMK
ncbi:class 1 isoprenoid biosynthesis enzyme [Paenibacillus kribbensis]|uniref:class 1 isoprenoid biosynthesis enzyme n=1 Tax=Paenibacillus kribbensis TaxID=172713 RepID=UPI000837D887|nr:class 1 isoprenoid biosynthesis enzyme [Paenibacillus kribbensis]